MNDAPAFGRRQVLAGLAVAGGALSACRAEVETEATPADASPRETAFTPAGAPLSAEQLDDAVLGASYLGCGGGGALAPARELIARDLAAGHDFRLLPVGGLADDDRVACPYALGSTAPQSEEARARLASYAVVEPDYVQRSFSVLQEYIGTPFSAVIMGEIGPLSLAEGLSTAARLGVPSLDADTVGRAVPEINQHSVKVAGLSLVPASCVSPQGDELVLTKVADPKRPEDIFRSISTVSRTVGVVDSPLTGEEAKRPGALVTDSVTLAMRIGAAARAGGIEAAREAGEGYMLFAGTVSGWDWEDTEGFLLGEVRVDGTGAFAGQTLRVDYKNEFLVARRDGEVVATCPDLITLIDAESAEGITAPDFAEGQEVVVLGFRCDPIWRTEAGLAVFSPRYFGFDIDYVPIEERLG